jgi:hypothetical protein
VAPLVDLNTALGILNAIGVVAGLLFTGLSFQKDSKARRMENFISITEHHRDIWTLVLDRPGLKRILRDDVDLEEQSVTDEEQLVSTLIILHVQIVHEGVKANLINLEKAGLERDLRALLRRPVLKEVWARIRDFQNKDFIRYVDRIVRGR